MTIWVWLQILINAGFVLSNFAFMHLLKLQQKRIDLLTQAITIKAVSVAPIGAAQ